jgi:hypothetical protein
MAPVDASYSLEGSNLSLAQGNEYLKAHAAQHGGGSIPLVNSAPVGYTGMLDDSLRVAARVAPLDQAISASTSAGNTMSGGARRRKGKKSTKKSRKGKKGSRKGNRKGSRKSSRRMSMAAIMGMSRKALKALKRKLSRKMRGGAALNPADYGAPGMLLDPTMQAKALGGMNPEWKLATDPAAFAPK